MRRGSSATVQVLQGPLHPTEGTCSTLTLCSQLMPATYYRETLKSTLIDVTFSGLHQTNDIGSSEMKTRRAGWGNLSKHTLTKPRYFVSELQ